VPARPPRRRPWACLQGPTTSDGHLPRPADLVKRNFVVSRPNASSS
jgi:hypothetical protein